MKTLPARLRLLPEESTVAAPIHANLLGSRHQVGATLPDRASNSRASGSGKGSDVFGAQLESAVVSFLEKLLGSDSPEDKVFNASPSTFRRRWAALTDALTLPKSLRLTPGGLRGGGAVYLYQRQVQIPRSCGGCASGMPAR